MRTAVLLVDLNHDLVRQQSFARTSGSMTAPRKRFEVRCIHHGDDTVDSPKLERHVEPVEEDKIISRRKQETTNINTPSCLYGGVDLANGLSVWIFATMAIFIRKQRIR
jgi:hypothetical protein